MQILKFRGGHWKILGSFAGGRVSEVFPVLCVKLGKVVVSILQIFLMLLVLMTGCFTRDSLEHYIYQYYFSETHLYCFRSITLAASPGHLPDFKMLLLFGCGALLLRGAGCTVNDLLDRDIDTMVSFWFLLLSGKWIHSSF